MSSNASALDALIRDYLLSKGWRLATDELSERWTRDEFKGWWRHPTTEAISDRTVSFAMAIQEQIEKEREGESYIW